MRKNLTVDGEKYDSSSDAIMHRSRVRRAMSVLIPELRKRAEEHDISKLSEPEESVYDKYIPILRKYKYGSKEYLEARNEMYRDGLRHHYIVNRHHPEHFENGIQDMNLIDIMEMVCDWYSASLVSDVGFIEGLDINKKKYNMSDDLYRVLLNTYKTYFKDLDKDRYIDIRIRHKDEDM